MNRLELNDGCQFLQYLVELTVMRGKNKRIGINFIYNINDISLKIFSSSSSRCCIGDILSGGEWTALCNEFSNLISEELWLIVF